ncbi:hypothetical protein Dimus_029247, partial [Dionaea muscipula]
SSPPPMADDEATGDGRTTAATDVVSVPTTDGGENGTLGSGESDISMFGYDLVRGDDGNDRNLRNGEFESGDVERQLLNEGEPSTDDGEESTDDGEERNNDQSLPLILDAPAQHTDGRPAPPSDGRPDHIHQPLPEMSTSPDVQHSSIQPPPSDVSTHQSSSVPPPSQPTRLPPR